MITHLSTDIDCPSCLAAAHHALLSAAEVDTVEEDVSTGCLVVDHRGDPEVLREMVARLAHRLVTADNGEVEMGEATVRMHRHHSMTGTEQG